MLIAEDNEDEDELDYENRDFLSIVESEDELSDEESKFYRSRATQHLLQSLDIFDDVVPEEDELDELEELEFDEEELLDLDR